MNPSERQLGSLQRRLQRSQNSGAHEDDDQGIDPWSPSRGGQGGERARRSRPLDEPDGPHRGSGSRRPVEDDDGYGAPARRSRSSGGASGRGGGRTTASGRLRGGRDGYADDTNDSREAPAYSPYPAYDPDESREYSAYDASAEGPAYGQPRGREAGSRHSTPRRRSTPSGAQRDEWNDYTNPLDDPRSPLRGSRGASQGRRPSQGGRGGQRYPVDDYPGYTKGEMDARGYPQRRGSRDGYGDGRYPNDAPARSGPRGWEAEHDPAYGGDDYASREGWAVPGDYSAPYTAYPPSMGQRGGFDQGSEMWSAVSAPARPRRTSGKGDVKPPAKRKGGALKVAFSLIGTLALIGVLGVEFGPKIYHLVLSRSGGIVPATTSVTCATETTPAPTATTAAKAKSASSGTPFATTAYSLTYPAGWQKSSQSGTSGGQCDVVYLFAKPGGGARFNIEEAGAFSSLTDLQVIQAEAQTALTGGSTLTEITSAATTQTIGGDVWQRREYQATTKSGVKLHLALLAGHHKGAGFAIVMLDSDTGFAADDTTIFEPILRSVTFV